MKGHVDWAYAWRDGPSNEFSNARREGAEATLKKIAGWVVFHALERGEASVTLTVRRADLQQIKSD